MSEHVYVDKAQVLAQLRSRKLHARADWVDRSLPGLIDADQNASLLRLLGIEVDATAAGGVMAPRSSTVAVHSA